MSLIPSFLFSPMTPVSKKQTRSLVITLIAVAACAALIAVAFFALRHLPTNWSNTELVQSASATGPLRMDFPETMDHASAEAALVKPVDAEGKLSWQGNTLLFTPTVPLQKDSTYAFVLEKTALSAAGKPIDTTFEFHFKITGDPVVSARIPAPNSADILTDTRITIVFDRPVVALGQLDNTPAPNGWEKVVIDPPTAGRWRWLSTYAAEFVPLKPLLRSQLYTVRVPAGIVTVNNETLAGDASWSFETVRPRVTDLRPEDTTESAGPGTPITVSFSQEVNLQSAAKHIELLLLNASATSMPGTGAIASMTKQKLSIKNVSYGKTTDEGNVLRDDHTMVVITPSQPLAFGSAYALRVSAGVQTENGGDLGSKEERVARFRTVGPLTLKDMKYENGGLMLQFSNPVSSGSLAGTITLSPKQLGSGALVFESNGWESDMSATSYPELAPGTAYTLTIAGNAADRYGQTLGKPVTKNFSTPDLPAQVTIDSRGEFGVFEREKPPIFHLSGVNVPSIEVDVAKISLDDFLRYRKEKTLNYSFIPDLATVAGNQHFSLPRKNVKNTWSATELDLQKLMKTSLGGGIYAVTIRAPGFINQWDKTPSVLTQYFTLTDTALTLKYSGDKALLWAVNMQTGKPVAGADVAFRALDGSQPLTGRTDPQGFLETPIPMAALSAGSNNAWQPEFWVTSSKGTDFAFVSSQWTDPVVTGNFGMWWDFHSPQSPALRPIVWLQTERPVYRPGDTVSFKGFVRLKDWEGKLQLPKPGNSAEVLISDPQGTEVWKKTLNFTEFGTFNATMPTTAASALGSYSVNVTMKPDGTAYENQYAGSFQLLAYRKPEYKVELTPRQEEVTAGDTVTVDLAGSYYFGAPLSGAKVQWRAELQDYYFNKVTDDWYSFSSGGDWCWWDCPTSSAIFTSGKGTLDEAGRLTITVPASIADKELSQILTVEADVTDPSSQVVSNRTSVVVHKSRVYVGIKTEDYVVNPGGKASTKIITVNPDGTPAPNKTVTLTLSSRTWSTISRKNVDGAYYYENEVRDDVVRTLSATTGADGKATVQVPVDKGGEFVITANVTDDRNRTAKASTSIYAWSSSYVNWPHTNNDRIDVLADKPEYAVGDTAKLLVKSPFQGEGVRALVTVERENVITRRVVDVKSNAESIEIPITEDLVPNAYVSVIVLKPRQGETFNENGLDTGAPSFKIGYAQLKIETVKKELSVTITPDQQRYLPGSKGSARFQVKDSSGKPVKAELSFAVVDASVLALTGYVRPDLVSAFYTEHGLGVFTAPMLQYLIDRYKPGSKGGGGGEDRVRQNFQDTAYWQPVLTTNDKGEADATFPLPDNVTTWQLLAVAATKDSKFGATEKEVLATKRVILRPVRPRFAVTGDRITLKAIVHNSLTTKATFAVSLTGNGFTLQGAGKETISLDADSQTTIEFPVTVTGHNGITMRFKAEAPDAKDEIVESIPTFEPGSPESVATWGKTEDVVKETVLAPGKDDASTGSLLVTVSPTIASFLPGGLAMVTNFPYGCAEQTASAFLPNVALSRLQGFDAFAVTDAKTLQTKVLTGLQTLYAFQRSDGGFGYWQESRQSSVPVSAYILYALETAKEGGYNPDGAVIARVQEYLTAALRNTQNPLDGATRAYVLYVLAETGKGDLNLALNLFDKREGLPVFAKAQLAMALNHGTSAAAKRNAKTLMTEAMNLLQKDGRGAHVEDRSMQRYGALMQTNQRATAVVLRGMLRIDPENVLIQDMIRWLLTSRREGHWDTTQSTTETILALTEYLKTTGELDGNFVAGIDLNGTLKMTPRFGAENILTKADLHLSLSDLKTGAANTLTIGKDGSGSLYYDILLTTVSPKLADKPREEGASIRREIRPISAGENAESVAQAKLGDLYAVTLTMTVPQQRFAVAVESPLPAGMEAVDTNLQTNAQTGELADAQRKMDRQSWWSGDNNLWYFSHRELRDDRVFLFADTLPAGTYRYTYFARATTPGTYQTRPARIWEMYQPEIFGATAGQMFTITE